MNLNSVVLSDWTFLKQVDRGCWYRYEAKSGRFTSIPGIL